MFLRPTTFQAIARCVSTIFHMLQRHNTCFDVQALSSSRLPNLISDHWTTKNCFCMAPLNATVQEHTRSQDSQRTTTTTIQYSPKMSRTLQTLQKPCQGSLTHTYRMTGTSRLPRTLDDEAEQKNN